MITDDPLTKEPTDPAKTVRAACEKMLVEKDGPDFKVVKLEDGERLQYHVFSNGMGCECADWEHRKPAGGCKHMRRIKMVLGTMDVPTGDELPEGKTIDPWLIIQRENYSRGAAIRTDELRDIQFDGGVAAQHPGKVDDEDTCDCHDCDCDRFKEGSLPCWSCYQDGVREVEHE